MFVFFFFQAEDGIRDYKVTGVQTCALPIYVEAGKSGGEREAGEGGEHEADVDDEEEIRVVACAAAPRSAAGARDDEQRHGERHHDETEQPVRPAAAPDQ